MTYDPSTEKLVEGFFLFEIKVDNDNKLCIIDPMNDLISEIKLK